MMDADMASQAFVVFIMTKMNITHLELTQKELNELYSRFGVSVVPKGDKVHFHLSPRWRGY